MEQGARAQQQEVDFEGRAKDPELLKDVALAACFDSGSNTQHHLVYTGLEGAGPHLAFLGATVCFSVSPEHVVEKLAGPMEVGEDGRVYAAVQFPSMSELWPDASRTRGVRVVQVDVHVVIHSEMRMLRSPTSDVKVTYRRTRVPGDDVVLWRPHDVLHTVQR